MARTILPLAGAFVGSFFGAPQLGFAIGSVIGNAVDPQRIKGPRIGDANVQTSQEGTPRPIVYGTAAVMGNLIDRGPLNKVITEERQGKGGGPVVENESLFMTFAIRICEGPIDGINRIWEDERLVYDVRPESEILADSGRYAQGFSLYLGNEDQLPDPDLESIHGVGNTPAHRGSAYIVFKEKNLTERRGSIPQFRFEVARCAGQPPQPSEIREIVVTTHVDSGLSGGVFDMPIPPGFAEGDAYITIATNSGAPGSMRPSSLNQDPGNPRRIHSYSGFSSGAFIRGSIDICLIRDYDGSSIPMSTSSTSSIPFALICIWIPSQMLSDTSSSFGRTAISTTVSGIAATTGPKQINLYAWESDGESSVTSFPGPNRNIVNVSTGSTESDPRAVISWDIDYAAAIDTGVFVGTGSRGNSIVNLALSDIAQEPA